MGAIIGFLLAAFAMGLDRAGVSPAIAAFLLVTASVVITGGLHLDGLADTSDGLFLSGDAERRLTVMRDPHVGSFGVAAIVLVLLGKFAALSSMTGHNRALAVLGAAIVGRCLILVSAGLADYARPQGTGRIIIDVTQPRDALGAASIVLLVGVCLFGFRGLTAGLIAMFGAWGCTRAASARLGGITGDILGAVVEFGELGFLIIVGGGTLA